MLPAFLSQSILHALLAAAFAEGLLRAWRVEDGARRFRMRLAALAVPLAWLPILFVVAPWRNSAPFVARWALFAGERWNQVHVGGAGLGDLALLLSAGLGSALFLRDAVPPLLDLVRGGGRLADEGSWPVPAAGVEAAVERYAAALGIPPPEVRVVRSPEPLLLCEGARAPGLVVSTSVVERLKGDDLDAAIAHELAHARGRDPAWGYALIAARALLFFNPAAQWVARALVDDIEWRADQTAVRLTGNAGALARAIALLFDAGHPPPSDGDASFERVFWRIRQQGVERRCARLGGASVTAAPAGWSPVVATVAAAGVLGLVFFVI